MSHKALQQILRNSDLAKTIQSLPAFAVSKVIQKIGLEDCSEIISVLTTPQLKQLLDADLWSRTQNAEEEFNSERFLTWIEVMMELGPTYTAEKLAEIDDDVVVLGFSSLMEVFSEYNLVSRLKYHEEEKLFESAATFEIDDYIIVFKKAHGADILSEVLATMSTSDHALLCRVLDRCKAITNDKAKESGIAGVFSAGEQVQTDTLQARERRRSEEGFISRSEALSFLNLARVAKIEEPGLQQIEKEYFSKLPKASPPPDLGSDSESRISLATISEILSDTEIFDKFPALLTFNEKIFKSNFRQHLERLQFENNAEFEKQMFEIAFLGNVLAEGCSLQGRPLRPDEIASVIDSTCQLGLEIYGMTASKDLGSIRSFTTGWNHLFQSLSIPALDALIKFVKPLTLNPSQKNQSQLRELLYHFQQAEKAKKPWLARSKVNWLRKLLGEDNTLAFNGYLDEVPHFIESAEIDGRIYQQNKFFASLSEVNDAQQKFNFMQNS